MSCKRIDKLMVKAGARFEITNDVDYEHVEYNDNTKSIVKDCLQIIADEGNFEGGAVRAFNTIKEKYEIDTDYNELAYADSNESF
jgi:hypothetical protein